MSSETALIAITCIIVTLGFGVLLMFRVVRQMDNNHKADETDKGK
jgi:hypothetical protein